MNVINQTHYKNKNLWLIEVTLLNRKSTDSLFHDGKRGKNDNDSHGQVSDMKCTTRV